MKGNEEVLNLLNQLLTNELTAINQYFIHAKMCSNWGYERLAEHSREESIEERVDREEAGEAIRVIEAGPGERVGGGRGRSRGWGYSRDRGWSRGRGWRRTLPGLHRPRSRRALDKRFSRRWWHPPQSLPAPHAAVICSTCSAPWSIAACT